MQMVIISCRPRLFAETLHHVSERMPFVDAVVVVAPDSMTAAFGAEPCPLAITVIGESEVISSARETLPRLDHQSRNFRLRTAVASHQVIDDEFIMADDDSRPLRCLTPEFFIEAGRFHSYYFCDLADWDYGVSSFDIGQRVSCLALKQEGMPHLSYASHMPQVVSRELFLEAADHFSKMADALPLCEWSTYFNFALHRHPDRFHESRPYETLAWPESPLSWPMAVDPPRYSFENFTPSLYEAGGPFAGFDRFSASADAARVLRKLAAWQQYTVLARQPELHRYASPGQAPRPTLKARAVGLARRLVRRLVFEEYARTAQIQMRLRILERCVDRLAGRQDQDCAKLRRD